VLNKESFVIKTYNFITEKFINNKIKMGERIKIDSISNGLGISQTPVREALNRLVRDGLVKNIQNVGYYVVDFGKKDIVHISVTSGHCFR